MKRIIATIITLTLLFSSLCACGNSKKSSKTETSSGKSSASQSESQKERAVGETLSKPEKTFEPESDDNLYLRFTTITGGETNEFEYAFENTNDDTYLLYVSNGLLKNNEIVYEVGDNEIKKYVKSALQDKFSLETLSYDELKDEVDKHMKLTAIFMNGLEGANGLEYKKKEDFDAPGTGDAYVYDVYENGEKAAEVMVNKDTGLYSKIKMEDGSMTGTLNEYKLNSFTIPEYK